jgi:membrane-associated protease RseP (regulator of RpoE activity)
MGLSFAIPIDVALDIQKQLRDKGRVARGRIGVVIQEVTRDLATSFGLDRPRGALVNSVEKSSPADKAGVEATDIIVSFDGKQVESSSDLPRIVGSTRPGSQSSLEVFRRGKTQKLSITVAELQEDRVAAREAPGRSKPQAEAPANRLGIVVGELSAEEGPQPAERAGGDRRARRFEGRRAQGRRAAHHGAQGAAHRAQIGRAVQQAARRAGQERGHHPAGPAGREHRLRHDFRSH